MEQLAIRNFPFFKDFLQTEISDLLKTAQLETVSSLEKVFRERELSDGFMFILEGRVALVHPNRHETKLGTFQSGDLIGELGFFADISHRATVVAEIDTRVLHFRREALDKLRLSSPSIWSKLVMAVGAAHVRKLNAKEVPWPVVLKVFEERLPRSEERSQHFSKPKIPQ